MNLHIIHDQQRQAILKFQIVKKGFLFKTVIYHKYYFSYGDFIQSVEDLLGIRLLIVFRKMIAVFYEYHTSSSQIQYGCRSVLRGKQEELKPSSKYQKNAVFSLLLSSEKRNFQTPSGLIISCMKSFSMSSIQNLKSDWKAAVTIVDVHSRMQFSIKKIIF